MEATLYEVLTALGILSGRLHMERSILWRMDDMSIMRLPHTETSKPISEGDIKALMARNQTLNSTTFRGHDEGKVLLANVIVTRVDESQLVAEYYWTAAPPSVGGVPVDKVYSKTDHNLLPGLADKV